jgi:hypothetical protein
MSLSSLKTAGRAAIVALTLGAASLSAMPAQAASPSFSLQLGIGNDGGVMGFDGKRAPRGFFPIKKCLSNSQVVRGLERYGFDDVEVVRKLSSTRVLVIGEWDWRYYSMKVNKCSGEVYEIRKLQKNRDYFLDQPGKPHGGFGVERDGFSFQFNF